MKTQQNPPAGKNNGQSQTPNGLGLLRVAQAAALMGVNHKMIRSLIASGGLPYRRFGKLIFIHKDDLTPPRIASRAEILG